MPQKNRLLKALIELHNFLNNEKIPFMTIGGIANLVWGEPRLTQDIDVTISTKAMPYFIKKVQSCFKVLPDNPIRFVEKTKVLPIEISGVSVDIIFAGTEYERIALLKSKEVEIQKGVKVRVCSPEDLVIHKAISERERDCEDIKGIILRQGERLDKTYILKWLNRFSKTLNRSDIIDKFNKLWDTLAEG